MKTTDALIGLAVAFGLYEFVVKPKTPKPIVNTLPGNYKTGIVANQAPQSNWAASTITTIAAAAPSIIDLVKGIINPGSANTPNPANTINITAPAASIPTYTPTSVLPDYSNDIAMPLNALQKLHLISGILSEEFDERRGFAGNYTPGIR